MTVEVSDSIMEEPSPDGYDQVMFTQNTETIKPFSSHMVPVKVGKAWRWLFATGPHCTKHMHRIEARKYKGSCGGKQQHGLLTDHLKENPSGQGSGSATCAQTT